MPNLGRGLEALIPKKEGSVRGETEHKKEAVFSIEIEKIKPNPYQPRKEFDEEGLRELAESIRTHGILQPLIVMRKEDPDTGVAEYQLIAGERRLRAAQMAGLSRVPVIIKSPSDKELLEMSLIENIQRENLTPLERAEAFERLHKEFGFSHKEIARLIGKSREYVTNSIRLLYLPPKVKEALIEGWITEGHARAIMMARTAEYQEQLLEQVQKEGLSVRETERAVQKFSAWRPTAKTRAFLAEFKPLEEKVKQILNIPGVKFKLQGGFPHLVISFNSKNEAEKFIQRLEKLSED
mgnify:CR=1 FL=1